MAKLHAVPALDAFDPLADVGAVARSWLGDCVRARLRSRGITATALEAALGDGRTTWQNKLNGTRDFRLDDLIRIIMAVDAELFLALPLTSQDLAEFFPPAYRTHLSHREVGRSMPTFAWTGEPWPNTCAELATWIVEERRAHRGWLLGPKSVARQILTALDSRGLRSIEATLAVATDTSVQVDWIAHNAEIRVLCPVDMAGVGPTALEVRDALRVVVLELVAAATQALDIKMLVVVGSPQVTTNLEHILKIDAAASTEWQPVGLSELRRLHYPGEEQGWPSDFHIQRVSSNASLGLSWLRVK